MTLTVWDWRRCALVLVWALAACAQGATPLPDGPGKSIVEAACSSCHSLEVITSKKLTRQRWQVLVLAMGPSLRKSEVAQAVEYLAKNFGDQDRGKELVEEICSLCHEWQRIKDQHLSKDEWAGTIKGMIFEGAPVTDEEFNLIVDYLAKNFGKTREN